VKPRLPYTLIVIAALALVGCARMPTLTTTPTPVPTPLPTFTAKPAAVRQEPTTPPELPGLTPSSPPSSPVPSPAPPLDPFDLISQESLLSFVQDLTAIQPYSGWRNSASQGEAEALDYVAGKLGEYDYLRDIGLELERQSFHVFLGTELWETRLYLSVAGQEIEVPADGLRGPRDDIAQALHFDSDGELNDSAPNPVVAEGPVVVVRSASEARELDPATVRGKIVFLDYAVIDRVLLDTSQAAAIASDLLEAGPAGLVLITTFSNQPGESHGSFVGDVSALNIVEFDASLPILYARLEDLAVAGIEGWDDLAQVQGALMTWDADVFSPANSGNLVAHIPGADPSLAMILGAHIDSPNAPGALDDGSGSALLLEVARVLDAARTQPPVDLYLIWFGSEELGLYGSSYFVATHQELLDRTLAMQQIDMLSRPLDGLDAELRLVTWSYAQLGAGRLAWPDYLTQAAARRGVETMPEDVPYVYSDNNSFGGFDVPHADLIYEPPEFNGSVHYASHIHDPYDTVELAREMGDVFEEMARVALAAALDTPRDAPALRVTPASDRRALFVASHTEAVHMTPIGFREMGMALAMEGWDVDMIPYGQAATPVDLADADLVVALPVMDYPEPESDPGLYDEAWTQPEIDALEAYAAAGGLLVLTNSAFRLKYGNQGLGLNEDWRDVNDLAGRFGVTFVDGTLVGTEARTEGDNPLVEGVRWLELGEDNGVPFELTGAAQILAQMDGALVAALLNFGDNGGQVLVLADVAVLTTAYGELQNLPFWRNLAQYARER
jgi:hypothetical protein